MPETRHSRQKKKEDSENTVHMKRPFVFAKVVPMHQNALALSKIKIPIVPATAPDNSYVPLKQPLCFAQRLFFALRG